MNLKLQTSAGVEYPLTTPSVTVGRENCDILLLQDTLVSRNHARFQVQGEVVTVTDLGSTNGTYINQVRLQPHIPQAIRVGDTVHIGNTTFTLRGDGGAGPTRAIGDMSAWQAPPARVPASWASDAMQARPAWIPPTPAAGSAPYPSPAPAYSYPTKSKSTGMLLEIGIGLFALMGFGWIYAGQTSTGVVLVIVNILLNLGYWFVATLTAGFSLLCTVPLQIAAVVISASKLNSYMSKNPDKFH